MIYILQFVNFGACVDKPGHTHSHFGTDIGWIADEIGLAFKSKITAVEFFRVMNRCGYMHWITKQDHIQTQQIVDLRSD